MKISGTPKKIKEIEQFIRNHFKDNDLIKIDFSCGDESVSLECCLTEFEFFTKYRSSVPYMYEIDSVNLNVVEIMKIDLNKINNSNIG